uniref:Protein-tyrosine phosphatase n=1 Tax=Panagrellus redivivus TaxID=6233 RepID=A0A7E4VDW4_PANRE
MKKKSATQRRRSGNTQQSKDTAQSPSRKKDKQASIQQDVDSQCHTSTASNAQPPTLPTPPPVAKCSSNARQEVEKWAKRALEKGINGLREEFLELKKYTPPDMSVTVFTANWEAGRNRYKDVPCQDKCRVVVKWPGVAHDYIHANYVATPISDKRFICTQGPLEATVADFWHMTVQEEADSIIMLCNIMEKGMLKCFQYWPAEENQTKVYGDVEVTNTLVRQLTPEEATVRLSVLLIKWKLDGKTNQREVRHYQWIDWPDRGVPPCRLTSMVLLSHVRGTKKPIIVHCSAGIGRTGTIVAIEFILERLQQGIPCEAMDEILKELRNQRPFSIQTDLQYLYVHRVMLYYFFEKYKVAVASDDIQAKYKKFVEDYDKAVA